MNLKQLASDKLLVKRIYGVLMQDSTSAFDEMLDKALAAEAQRSDTEIMSTETMWESRGRRQMLRMLRETLNRDNLKKIIESGT